MAYDKQTWTAREGTNLKKYTKASETATTVILTNTPDSISVEGTPFSVDRMNYIEEGIESAHENTDALKITDPNVYYFPLSQTIRNWTGMTTLGSDVYACVSNGDIYKQTGGTGNFVALSQTPRAWYGMATLGSDVYASVASGDIYKQTSGTGNFVALGQTSRNWRGMTALGSDLYACVYGGDIYKRIGGTGDFVALSQTSRSWTGMATLGSDVYACDLAGDIYKQTGGTGNFVALSQTPRQWTAMTTLGSDVYACASGGDIYKQTGGTGNFVALGQISISWAGMTNNGTDIYSCVSNGDIYKQTPTKALEVYSTAETLTNQTFLGYPVYRKVINFGALPNNTTKSVAHGLTRSTIFNATGWAYNPSPTTERRSYITLPNAQSPSSAYCIQLHWSDTNVSVTSARDETSYTKSYITIEYVKAAL